MCKFSQTFCCRMVCQFLFDAICNIVFLFINFTDKIFTGLTILSGLIFGGGGGLLLERIMDVTFQNGLGLTTKTVLR